MSDSCCSWVSQKVSAVVISLIMLIIFLEVCVVGSVTLMQFITQFPLTVFSFLIAIFAHALLGIKNVITDYIKSSSCRYILHFIILFTVSVTLFMVLRILFAH